MILFLILIITSTNFNFGNIKSHKKLKHVSERLTERLRGIYPVDRIMQYGSNCIIIRVSDFQTKKSASHFLSTVWYN